MNPSLVIAPEDKLEWVGDVCLITYADGTTKQLRLNEGLWVVTKYPAVRYVEAAAEMADLTRCLARVVHALSGKAVSHGL